jgi:hypothetical protein
MRLLSTAGIPFQPLQRTRRFFIWHLQSLHASPWWHDHVRECIRTSTVKIARVHCTTHFRSNKINNLAGLCNAL